MENRSIHDDVWLAPWDPEEKHIIISHLVERIEIGEGYEITIHFRVAAESLVRKSA